MKLINKYSAKRDGNQQAKAISNHVCSKIEQNCRISFLQNIKLSYTIYSGASSKINVRENSSENRTRRISLKP